MTRIITLLIAISLLTGCSQVDLGKREIPKHLKLKAPKEKILAHKIIKQRVETPMLGGKATSTEPAIEVSYVDIVKYDYISENKAEGKFLFNGKKYTNAKVLKENGNEKTVAFYVGDHFSQEEDGIYEIEQGATTTLEVWEEQTKISFIDKLLGREVNATDYYSGSGDVYWSSGTTGLWDTNHDATSKTAYVANNLYAASAKRAAGDNYEIDRIYLPFDASALPDNATISAATVNGYVFAIQNSDNDGDDWIVVVQSFPATNNSPVDDDYDQIGDAINNPTEGSNRIDLTTGFTNNAYNAFTLDSTGRGWISKTGWTNLGLREGHDVLDHIYAGGDQSYNYIAMRDSEAAGTDTDPYLSVTYTEVSRRIINIE